ncbi:hypothetical protein WJX82_006747 [Trebouxia sp. C0006]
MKSLRSQRSIASLFASVVATILVGGLCTCIIIGNLQPGAGSLRHPSGRHLLQEDSSPAAKAHQNKLHHVHGWLMCLSWGFLIPLGVVIACFRTVRGMGNWWFHLHRALQTLGFLVSLAGLAVGVYLDPGQGGLFWQHKIIGVVVNVLALVQVLAGILIRVPNTSNLRRVWNLTHWTLGRSAVALGIANIFIGMFLSSLAYKNIIAQAVVLGGLFIIVMLKNDVEYLLVGGTPAEEEAKLKAAGVMGSQRDLGQTNFPALATANGKGKPGKGRNVKSSDASILESNNSITATTELTPTNGSETVV